MRLQVPGGGQASVLVRLTREGPDQLAAPFAGADELIARRRTEADEFYEAITPPAVTADAKAVMRQALAGMLWSKQCYYFDVDTWLRERRVHPLRAPLRRGTRNESWFHMFNHDIVSMPDKWEYPWYAAWDLAFHCVPLAMVDPDFAKGQVELMLSQEYLHPTGQMPAYEWNFGDVNPPVHAFATLFLQNLQAGLGEVDLPFLKKCFSKLLLNFTWWVNRKDPSGRNVFEGGFLGLDNIGVFDRSATLPTGGQLEQADGTAWMAMFSQNMLELALALLDEDPSYEEFVHKFVERFFWIAAATDPVGDNPDELWDEEDGFFYDVLRLPDGTGNADQGALPRGPAAAVRHGRDRAGRHRALPAGRRAGWRRSSGATRTCWSTSRTRSCPASAAGGCSPWSTRTSCGASWPGCWMRSASSGRTASARSRAGTSTTRTAFSIDGVEHQVQYEPAESTSAMFGGNSNWRGPVWFPVNLLLIKALISHYRYYGDDLKVECPTGSGTMMNLLEVAKELARRLVGIFLRDADGRRPVYGGSTAVPGGPALAGPHPVLRVLPRRQRRGPRRLAPDRLDRPGGDAHPELGPTSTPRRCSQDRQWPLARPYRRAADPEP